MSSILITDEDGLHQKLNGPNVSASKHERRLFGDEESTEIQRFYSGSSVLVTGATGFMGKVLIEKLLRSCPDIHSVYMMMREKKGRSLDERIDDLISSPCFDRVRKEQPGFRSKLHAVAGDIGLEGLGISKDDRNLLEQQINIVFHVAATVRFDEHLKLAILQNVRGTRDILNLSRTFRNIKAVVHVSTAYSNCPTKQIDERIYKPHLPSDQIIHLAENLDTTTLDRLSHKLMGKWPNTYAFTKALSEDVVKNHSYDLPVAVFRPAIVVCTKNEPFPGWIDNLYGPTGVIVGCTAGLIRTMNIDPDEQANIVPCDMAINALIASAWHTVENKTSTNTPVFNYVQSETNKNTWGRLTDDFIEQGSGIIAQSRAIWVPTMTYIGNETLYLIFRMFVHFLPALLMDLYLMATRRSPMMVKIYNKIHKFSMVLAYFGTQHWHFETKNVDDMWKRLHYNDKELFFFNMDAMDNRRSTKECFPGMRRHIMNDPDETMLAALKKQRRFAILHRLLKFVLQVTALWISMQVLSWVWSYLLTAAQQSWVRAHRTSTFNTITVAVH